MKNGGADGAGPVIDYLRSKGIDDNLAKGIAANVEAESGFNPNAVGDGGKAYGLLQWHPSRQADFAAYLGKSIRESTWQEQLDFAVYEATKGKEKANWAKVENSQSPSEAASNYSKYVIRPAEEERQARERAEIAAGYGAPAQQPRGPVLDLSDPDQWKKTQAGLASGPSIFEQIDAWAKSQRRAPETYTASDVVAPSAAPQAPNSAPQDGEWHPVQRNDNRQYHIHGADIGKVKQLLNEEMSTLINHTTENFKSAEK
nr:phage tail tip lysozyme [Pseudomonas sp. Eb3]